MFDLGDELIIGSQRIPWLVWIQLLVMLLLIILLYYFTFFAVGLDVSPNAASSSPSTAPLASTSESRQLPNAAVAASSSRLHSSKVGERQSNNRSDTGTSISRRKLRREDIQERETSSSAKDASHFEHSYHPCHYLGLAKQAFLKCLGFDPASKDPSNSRNTREK